MKGARVVKATRYRRGVGGSHLGPRTDNQKTCPRGQDPWLQTRESTVDF